MDGCKLLIRTYNSIITNGVSPSGGWTELIGIARDDKDLVCPVSGDFVYLSTMIIGIRNLQVDYRT